jgi:hypothetical protein
MPGITTFDSRLNLPDPNSQIIDWSKALNTFLVIRQRGLENQWQQKRLENEDKKMTLDAMKSAAELDMAGRRLDLQTTATLAGLEQDKLRTEFERKKMDAAISRDKAGEALDTYMLGKQQDSDAADGMYARLLATPLLNPIDRDISIATDPMTIGDVTEHRRTLVDLETRSRDPGMRSLLTDLSQRGAKVKTDPKVAMRLHPEPLVTASANAAIYDSGIPKKTVTIEEGAAIGDLIRWNGRNENEIPEAERRQLEVLANQPQSKVKWVVGDTVKYSLNELEGGVRSGDPAKTRTYLKYAKANPQAALDFVKQTYGGDMSRLMLHDSLPDTPANEPFLRQPPEVDAAIGQMMKSAGITGLNLLSQAMTTAKLPDGTTVNTAMKKADGTPLTNADVLHETWQQFARGQGYPARVVKQGDDMLSRYEADMAKEANVAPVQAGRPAQTEISPDMTLREAMKVVAPKVVSTAAGSMLPAIPAVNLAVRGIGAINNVLDMKVSEVAAKRKTVIDALGGMFDNAGDWLNAILEQSNRPFVVGPRPTR